MVSAQAARNVVGVIGNVISFGLFLSPVPTFRRIYKKKDVEQFQFYPYVATVLNCLFWILYGMPFVTPNSILVVTINSIGLVIELIYLAIFCIYDRENKGRTRVAIGLVGEVIFMAAMVAVTLVFFHHKGRTTFVGIWCDAFNIMMYTSPLLIMGKVIKTKSVEYMPLYLSLANFLNGCIWTAYALIIFDPYILASNGIGAVAGAAQLILYACYYKFTPKHDSTEAAKPSEIQLSGANAAARV